jgi:metallo-beta-lactamase class B
MSTEYSGHATTITYYTDMKKTSVVAILTICSLELCFSQSTDVPIPVSKDIEVIQISPHAYVHRSYGEMPPWGIVPSNGLIYVSGGEALLFDTPATDSLTKVLVGWMIDSLRVRIVGFVPNHWHADCMGGLGYVHAVGIPSYAQEKTIAIAKLKGLPNPQHSFSDSLILHAGMQIVVCRYFGGGHSVDNIVSWIPSEGVLFGGCMVKDLTSETLGNTIDADLGEWPATIGRVLSAYPDVRIVVPGHGAMGGRDLLTHTQVLLAKIK